MNPTIFRQDDPVPLPRLRQPKVPARAQRATARAVLFFGPERRLLRDNNTSEIESKAEVADARSK